MHANDPVWHFKHGSRNERLKVPHPAFTSNTYLVLQKATLRGLGIAPGMPIWSEEMFGPVLAVREVDGFDEAVAAANDSRYGLSASVFTRSLEPAHRFAELADAGQVAVNLPTSGWDLHMPFGGFRESGSAFKEQGLDALRFYTRTKTVAVHYGG